LQYYIIFVLLIIEIVFVLCLLFPLPYFVVGAILNIMFNLRHMFRFTIVVLLFYTVDQTLEMRRREAKQAELPSSVDMNKENFYWKEKFRTERNFYLCAFTFTLLVILLRLETIVRRLREVQSQLLETKEGKKEQ